MRTPLSLALGIILLGTAPLAFTSCSSAPEDGAMEARVDAALATFEQERNELQQELLGLRNELDQKLLKVEAGLADPALTEEERMEHEELRSDLAAQHERVEVVLNDLSEATVDTWQLVKSGANEVSNDVGRWVETHAENVLETVEDATQPVEESTEE